jgi:hypothetical protein
MQKTGTVRSNSDATNEGGQTPHAVESLASSDVEAVLRGCSAAIGLHPDGATDALVDFALFRGIPFAVVPCCTFSKHFQHRRTAAGGPVRTPQEHLDFLQAKDLGVRRATLDLAGRNTVLYHMGRAGSRGGEAARGHAVTVTKALESAPEVKGSRAT